MASKQWQVDLLLIYLPGYLLILSPRAHSGPWEQPKCPREALDSERKRALHQTGLYEN